MNQLQRILYVEDDPDIQAVAKLALEVVGGFTVQTCGRGAQALQLCVDFAPDLVLLDVMMPEMDGPSTLAALRELPGMARIPVVFMTAKVQFAEITYYKSLGAREVISKPFDPMLLSDQLRRIWQS
jgi:CheY-like chemotaxis protein